MVNSLKIGLLAMVKLLLAACMPAPEEMQPTLTMQVDTLTPTITQRPTNTPRPTLTYTPIPTATFTPWPTKQVLAQFGVFGGDGGWEESAFIGGDMPEWILYADGQMIFQKEDHRGVWLAETTLTIPQTCSFLSQIAEAGFFSLVVNESFEPAYPTDYPNPIYNFDATTQFSEGGTHHVLQVNGPNPRQIRVYSHYAQYLTPEARRVFNLFQNYSPPSRLTEYQAQHMILRIEEGPGDSAYSTPAPITQSWPTDLPPLEVLATENVATAASAFFARGTNQIFQVLVSNEQVEPIFNAFGNRLAYQLFQSGDRVYYVAGRPFLPHETLSDFSEFPEEKQFALPFKCSN